MANNAVIIDQKEIKSKKEPISRIVFLVFFYLFYLFD